MHEEGNATQYLIITSSEEFCVTFCSRVKTATSKESNQSKRGERKNSRNRVKFGKPEDKLGGMNSKAGFLPYRGGRREGIKALRSFSHREIDKRKISHQEEEKHLFERQAGKSIRKAGREEEGSTLLKDFLRILPLQTF